MLQGAYAVNYRQETSPFLKCLLSVSQSSSVELQSLFYFNQLMVRTDLTLPRADRLLIM